MRRAGSERTVGRERERERERESEGERAREPGREGGERDGRLEDSRAEESAPVNERANAQALLKAAPRSFVQLLRTVCRADDEYAALGGVFLPRRRGGAAPASASDAVELDEELRLDAARRFVLRRGALRESEVQTKE